MGAVSFKASHSSVSNGEKMKLLYKFASLICLFGLSANLGLAAQETPAQPATAQSTPTQPATAANSTSATPTDASAKPPSADASYNGVKVADAKGKQTDAHLIFSDSSNKLVVRVADREFVAVPYDRIDKFSYEFTKKHRVTQGAIVIVASLGAGAIVMLTKSKSHWLYIDYREQDAPRSIVLRMDKNEYKNIIAAVKTHTGKEVEFLKEGDKEQKAKKSGDKGQP